MNAIFVFLALVTLSAAQLKNLPHVDVGLNDLWTEYKDKYSKIYEAEEEISR